MTQSSARQLPVILSAQPKAKGCGSTFGASATSRRRSACGDTLFEAHLAGQSGARRGLKGGTPVLDAARTAYLTAQWTGSDDRRPALGLLRRVSI